MVCLYSMLAFVMCFAQGKCDGYCDNDTIGLLQDRKTSVPTKNQIAALQPTAPPRFQWSKPVFPPIQCGSSHGDAKLSFFKNITYWRSKDQSHQTTIPLNCENLCGQHLSGQLVYFGVGSCDGLGGALGSMIFHLAVAYKHSFRFGGMVFANCTRDAEYKNKISGMLGINYDNIVLAGDGPFSFKTCLHPDSDVDNLQHVGYRDGPLIYDYHSYGLTANDKNDGITPKFLQSLRATSSLDSVILEHYNQTGYQVAVHVRRGDVGAEMPNTDMFKFDIISRNRRFAKDEVYLEVVRQVEELFGGANVNIHIFSTTMAHINGKPQLTAMVRNGTARKFYNESNFHVYKKKGYFVHLDGDELIDFAHLAKADVLIAAPSSFSLVAALFNSKCVVTFKDYGSPLPDWAQHSNGSFSSQSLRMLQDCVRKLDGHEQ